MPESFTFADSQLDEALTLLMGILVPDEAPFETVAPVSEQNLSEAFTLLMNKNANMMHFYSEMHAGLSDILKYNLSGWTIEWDYIIGKKLPDLSSNEVLWEGNNVKRCDLYNLFFDPTVLPATLPECGEFFAEISLLSTFALQKLEREKKLFDFNPTSNSEILNYYHTGPIYPTSNTSSAENVGTAAYYRYHLLGNVSNPNETSQYEVINFTGWIIPSKFGLSSSKEMEIWKITIVSDRILFHKKLNYVHGKLPIVMCFLPATKNGMQEKSYAEKLIPLQIMASHLLNTYSDSIRKALYGITLYDTNLIHKNLGSEINTDRLVNAILGVELTGANKDKRLDQVFYQHNNAPETDKLLPQLSSILQIMQNILPTDMLRQVTDLQRATRYQAAATVQASNRRGHKLAMLIDDQVLSRMRDQLVWNIKQFQKNLTLTQKDGSVIEFIPEQVSDLDISFNIGHGIKGLDRLIVTDVLLEISSRILQSQEAMAQIDVVALLDYITSVAGDTTDLTQFRKPPTTPIPTPA